SPLVAVEPSAGAIAESGRRSPGGRASRAGGRVDDMQDPTGEGPGGRVMSRRLATLTIGLVGAVSGCAGPLRCERSGGVPWHRIESPHLVIDTDVDPFRAMELARRMEVLLDALSQFLMSRPPELTVHVALFAEPSHYHLFAPEHVKALTVRS